MSSQSDHERDLGTQAGKGMEAKLLLENPLIVEFLDVTEESLITGIKITRPDEYEKREEYYKMLKTLDSFRNMLYQYIQGGEVAAQMLEDIKRGAYEG